MPKRVRNPGEFCWINVLTPAPDDARQFFSKLLGWSFGDIPGMGYSIKVDGSDVGGLFDLNGPGTPPGTPAGIGVMVKVDSADAMADRAKSLGGKAKPPFDVGPPGRMAECWDPVGANFDLWQPGGSPGTDADGAVHGAPSWFELITTDTATAGKFYAALFGWTSTVMPMGDFDYTVFKLGDAQVAGMMPRPAEMGDAPPHWGVYVTVKDADATAKLAAELGGSVVMPPMDIPNIGRFCGLVSPGGVMFYAITYSM